jgi:hypothetical protein
MSECTEFHHENLSKTQWPCTSGIYSSPLEDGRMSLPLLGRWGIRHRFGWSLHGRFKSPAAPTGSAAVRGSFVDNRPLRFSFLFFLFFCVVNASAQVNHYYVATTGSDSGSGSQASPWKTINHASSALSLGSGGTVVHIAQGTYGCVTTNRSGTSSQRIVYVSDSQYGAKISCNSTVLWQNNGDYVDINGFEVTASGSSACEGIRSVASFVHTIRNYVHDIPAISSTCTNGGDAIAFGWDGNHGTNSNNVADANITDAVGVSNGSCPNMHGIYGSTPRNTITNNIISRACGWGIHIYHDSTTYVVSNNVIINNKRGGILIGSSDGTTNTNSTVANNIVANNGGSESGITDRYGAGSGNVYLNNVMYNNLPGNFNLTQASPSGTVSLSSSLFNGLFVKYTGNAMTGDYHLQSSSMAVGAGVTRGCAGGGLTPCVPSTDFDGVSRVMTTSAVDAGAFAMSGDSASGSAPAAPSGLTAVVQ